MNLELDLEIIEQENSQDKFKNDCHYGSNIKAMFIEKKKE